MDKKQILNILAKEAAQAAKDQATATLAALSADDLRPLVAEQLKNDYSTVADRNRNNSIRMGEDS